MMRRSPTQRSIEQLASLPTAQGGLTRLAVERVRKAGIKLVPLLSDVGLTVEQIDEPEHRISVRNQIAFLDAAAKALNDEFIGLNLAADFDCRAWRSLGSGLRWHSSRPSCTQMRVVGLRRCSSW